MTYREQHEGQSYLLLIHKSLPTSYVLVVNDLVLFAVLKVEFVSLKVTHANTVTVPSSVSAERDWEHV